MNTQHEIPIFFGVDDAYAPFLSVALHSAIENSSPARQYRAIVLYQSLSEENRRRLGALAADHFAVEFVPMQNQLDCITDRMENRLRSDCFTLTIYFRLFIAAMFPQYDKGIYIDSDVAVTGDLAELYDIDLGDHLIGACSDLSVADVPFLTRYMNEAVGVDYRNYVNSGVLLMNLKELRRARLDTHFLGLLTTYGFDSVAPDQDYLNAICKDRIHYLPPQWNTMPNESRPPLQEPKLVHYNLYFKPWHYDGIQYEDYFWKYAESSGYFGEIRSCKEGFTEERKQADREGMETLIRRSCEIVGHEVTLRKIAERGVRVRL